TLRPVIEGVDVLSPSLLVRPDAQVERLVPRHRIAKSDHLAELPSGIDVQQRERQFRRQESLLGEPEENRGVFADRVEEHRTAKRRGGFAKDVDALGLELLKMRQRVAHQMCPRSSSSRMIRPVASSSATRLVSKASSGVNGTS